MLPDGACSTISSRLVIEPGGGDKKGVASGEKRLPNGRLSVGTIA
jgi:hypothetical protein